MVIASLPLVRSGSPECRAHFATAGGEAGLCSPTVTVAIANLVGLLLLHHTPIRKAHAPQARHESCRQYISRLTNAKGTLIRHCTGGAQSGSEGLVSASRPRVVSPLGVQVVRRPQRQPYRRRSRKAFIPNKAAGVRLATRESSFCLAIRRDPSVTSKASAGMPRATKNSQCSEPYPMSGSGPL